MARCEGTDGRVAELGDVGRRGFDAPHGYPRREKSIGFQWFEHKDNARPSVCAGKLAGGSVDRSAEYPRKLHRRRDLERAVRCMLGEVGALEKDVARKIVGFAFELIGDVRRQSFLTILKETSLLQNFPIKRFFS